MRYDEEKHKATTLSLIGFATAIPLGITFVISILLMIYHRLDNGSAMGSAFARPFKQIVFNIYDQTRFLELFWTYSPIPNPLQIKDIQNLYFLLVYLLLLAAASFIGAGRKLRRKLRSIDAQIERQQIAASIQGRRTRTVEEVREALPLQTNSIWPALHKNYIAPLAAAVGAGVILRLVFGAG